MAPKKGKRQGKRNNVKIKSKLSPRKRGLKIMKKAKSSEKPLDKLPWLNKMPADTSVNKSETVPQWLNSCVYKHGRTQYSSSEISSAYDDTVRPEEDEKSTTTDVSDECNCSHAKYSDNNKGGILKHKISSTNSVVAKYIKSGMDHVASFIVESAIRFGEEHGVVVADKNSPNVYEIMAPNKPYSEKSRKIRFKVPDKMVGYEEAKKIVWRSGAKDDETAGDAQGAETTQGSSRRSVNPESRSFYESKSSSWSSKTEDSLEDILPLLEKLKDGGDIVSSELDIEKLARSKESDDYERKRSRVRDKYRAMDKRYKSSDDLSKESGEGDYESDMKPMWKRFKRDSLELGRQRLRAAACSRQQERLSPSPY